jgi:hypothetical protein
MAKGPPAVTKGSPWEQLRENKEMKQRKEGRKAYCCDWRRWWYGERRRRARIGIFLIIIGVLWMGSKLGFFNPAIFWPLAFITIGIWIIVSGQTEGDPLVRATDQRATFGSGSVLRDKKSK